MKYFRVRFAAGLLAIAAGFIASAHSPDSPKLPQAAAAKPTGVHDFDFQVGDWRVHHRVKRPNDSQ